VPRLNTDTRSEILAVASELFAERGYQQTSLREIAERLGITKAALYYHFPSKRDLLSAMVDPLLEELHALADDIGRRGEVVSRDPRPAVEAFFAICLRRRLVLRSLLRDPQTLHEIEIVNPMSHWRERIDALLVGSEAPAERVRAVIALGGLQDTVMLFEDDDVEAMRDAAIEAAMRALLPSR
jgi:AcrR family transcriptional regulator